MPLLISRTLRITARDGVVLVDQTVAEVSEERAAKELRTSGYFDELEAADILDGFVAGAKYQINLGDPGRTTVTLTYWWRGYQPRIP